MSFVAKRECDLIIDLLLGRISEHAFYQRLHIQPGSGSREGVQMLARALREADPTGVEFGLYLVHRFGFRDDALDTLLALATAPWHFRHEDVVDAIVKLRDPRSVEALFAAAPAKYPYRDYDEANSLAKKCIRGLGNIATSDALVRLRSLTKCGDRDIEAIALKEIQRLQKEGHEL